MINGTEKSPPCGLKTAGRALFTIFVMGYFFAEVRLSFPKKKSAIVPGPTCEPVQRS